MYFQWLSSLLRQENNSLTYIILPSYTLTICILQVFSNNEELCGKLCTLGTGLKEFLTEAISSVHSEQHEMVHIMKVVVMVRLVVSQCSQLYASVCSSLQLP